MTDLPVSKEEEEVHAPPPSRPPPPKRRKPLAKDEGQKRLDPWMKRDDERPEARLRPFDLRDHERSFDPMVHGYVLKKNEMFYRYPDGRFLRVMSGVNTLTSDGQLLPDP